MEHFQRAWSCYCTCEVSVFWISLGLWNRDSDLGSTTSFTKLLFLPLEMCAFWWQRFTDAYCANFGLKHWCESFSQDFGSLKFYTTLKSHSYQHISHLHFAYSFKVRKRHATLRSPSLDFLWHCCFSKTYLLKICLHFEGCLSWTKSKMRINW